MFVGASGCVGVLDPAPHVLTSQAEILSPASVGKTGDEVETGECPGKQYPP